MESASNIIRFNNIKCYKVYAIQNICTQKGKPEQTIHVLSG